VDVVWTGMVRFDEIPEQRRQRLRGTGTFGVSFVKSGLPLPYLGIELWQESSSIDVPGFGAVQHTGTVVGDRVFPTTIEPVAFAFNTLLYAAMLWLLFAFPGALRRRRRFKRGLCPACAYPIGESTTCTECGNQLKPRRGAECSHV
jgi:hypothetical protein